MGLPMNGQTVLLDAGTDHTIVARAAVDKLFRTEGGRQALWVVNKEFWVWNGERWTYRPREEVEKAILEWLEDALIPQGEDEQGNGLFKRASKEFSGRDIREIVWMVERMCQAPIQSLPRWLESGNWPDPDHCIAFQDVVVDVAATAKARREGDVGAWVTLPRDDRFFGTVLTVPFTPGSPCPVWERCQGEWSGGDHTWQELRERAYGYALMSTRKYGKSLLEQGRTHSGKGTGSNDVLRPLLGGFPALHATTMDQVVDGFGLDGLHVCQVWVVSEMRDMDRGTGSKFASIWKMVLGRDGGMVNIKNVRQLKGVVFRCFPILQSNPMPAFPDDGGAVTSKLLVLPFRHSFVEQGKRDEMLPVKLREELPGIGARLAEAAVRLEMAPGKEKWPVVEGAAEVLAQMAMEGNPFDAFLKWAFVPAKMTVSQDYIAAKRVEFEATFGIQLRQKNGRRVPDSQLAFYLEHQSTWKLGRQVGSDGKTGITGLGIKAITVGNG
jgi:hypothetical protein